MWNAYNRYTIAYEIPSNPDALVPVTNPHFTFHPIALFHLKGQLDKSTNDEDLFSGIADVGIVIQQAREMPWLRLTSAPIKSLPAAKSPRNDGIDSADIVCVLPAIIENVSGTIEVDFIHEDDVVRQEGAHCHKLSWRDFNIRVKLGSTAPQIVTLAWFHQY